MEHFKNYSLQDLVETIDGILYKEQWADILGFEGKYMISDFGRVKSLLRIASQGKCAGELIRKSYVQKRTGYVWTTLCNGSKKRRYFLLHKLVAPAFIENPLNLPEINHKDGNKLNNRKSNLEWTTRSFNMKHSYASGLRSPQQGEKHPSNKLNNKQVLSIFNNRTHSGKELSQKFGVAQSSISQIKNGISWKHITSRV